MRELIWKLFPPYEVVIYKKEVDMFLDRNFDDSILYDDLFDLNEFAHKLAILNPATIVEQIRIKHRTAEEFAISSTMITFRNRLRSRRHHDGDHLDRNGKRLLKLIHSALQELVQLKHMTEESANDLFDHIEQSVR